MRLSVQLDTNSRVWSVEQSSTMMSSWSSYVWDRTLRTALGSKFARLYVAITTLTLGESGHFCLCPSATVVAYSEPCLVQIGRARLERRSDSVVNFPAISAVQHIAGL